MAREFEEDRIAAANYYYRHSGEHILGPTVPTYNDPEFLAERKDLPNVAPVQIRRNWHQMLLRQVARIGLKIEFDQRVERYFEDEDAGLSGIVTQSGSVRFADVVVAADALKSRSELLIAGEHVPTRSSGMSVYRVAFPTEMAMQSELFRNQWGKFVEKGESVMDYWLGPGMHIGTFISPEITAWGLTPRDSFLVENGGEPTETWDADVEPEEVIRVLNRIPGWHPAIEGIIRAAPAKGAIVHWPLLWRDLRSEWTSKGGRVVQVGDAAHAFIPTSVSGGTHAIEDGITLATTLQLACSSGGSNGVPMGTRIYNLLRYQRVSCAQKMAFVNSQLLGATDWDEIKKDPMAIRIKFPKWMFRHDPEDYAYRKYGQAFAHLAFGAPFQNDNFPPGHKFKPWTIDQVHRDIAAGKGAVDFLDGDWE